MEFMDATGLRKSTFTKYKYNYEKQEKISETGGRLRHVSKDCRMAVNLSVAANAAKSIATS